MPEVKEIIEAAWDQRAEITPDTASRELKSAVEEVINQLDAGQIRVAEKKDGTWVTNEWVKKAEVDSGRRAGVPTEMAEKLKALERENRELRQANEILRKASAYFAMAELDRRSK